MSVQHGGFRKKNQARSGGSELAERISVLAACSARPCENKNERSDKSRASPDSNRESALELAPAFDRVRRRKSASKQGAFQALREVVEVASI
jgi:hypothetical protein